MLYFSSVGQLAAFHLLYQCVCFFQPSAKLGRDRLGLGGGELCDSAFHQGRSFS